MTSSLVGSEMCIRDSPCVVLSLAGQAPLRILQSVWLPLSRRMSSGLDRAVSYTHLTLPTICSV
eukprot:2970414-Prorocentrum_lima.AAC.1